MGKKYKLISGIFGLLGVACFGLFFVLNDSLYKVDFDTDGGSSIEGQLVKKNEKATKPTDPTKEGFAFSGWALNGVAYDFEQIVTNSITLKALWNKVAVINISLDGKDYTQNYVLGEKINISDFDLPMKEGYKIVLYEKSADNLKKEEEFDLETGVNGPLNFIGEYHELKMITITFDSDGGSTVEPLTTYEETIIDEPKVTKAGFSFIGWFKGDQKFDFSQPVMGDMTLVASWKDGNKVNVNFYVDDKKYDTIAVAIGAKVSKPANPVKEGYIFEYWKHNGKEFDFETAIEKDLTLTANFRVAKIFKVTFNSDGGTDVKGQDVNEGDKLKKPADPTKVGYRFVGWTYENKLYNFELPVTAHMTLKAKWEKNDGFIVKFDSDGGTAVDSQKVKPNQTATKPADPVKSGFTFGGWQLNGVDYNFSSPVTSDITLKAVWNEATLFKVSFNTLGGSVVNSQFVKSGATCSRPADPVKSGFTFGGWQLNGVDYNFSSPVTSDIVLTAKWN